MYIHGREQDVIRLMDAIKLGGQHLCKYNKMEDGKLTTMSQAELCDIDYPTASTITSRYYKGVASHKDNMVMEIWRLDESDNSSRGHI